MNRLSVGERALILHSLCEGMSMRSCERVFRKPFGTISRIVREVGDWAIDHQRNLAPVTCDRIQVDELWSFVGENDRRSALKRGDGGVSWVYLGVDRRTSLVITYHIGLRGKVDATKFFRKLDNSLAKDASGDFICRPTIASDGMKAYRDAAEIVFADRVNFGQYSKIYTDTDDNEEPTPRSKFAGAHRLIVIGQPALEDITTWRVERENGFVRQSNRRLTRKTNAFSKALEYHERQLAISIMFRNYCWIPRPKRPTDGSSSWVKRVPAAIECGLTDRVWTPEDMIVAADEFIARQGKSEPSLEQPTARDQEKRFWVVHQPYHQKAMIHKAECSSCKGGLGRMDGSSKITFWCGLPTLEEATALAAEKEPDEHKICKKCLGQYNTLTRYGRRL
ncbi:IS1 family transposase (plasmid) [Sphingomonas daechungensis]|uniref:IS1 family transposase n=1 Tax=Sphingomonas daechungensis TaxID=1176646 RepID=A0ABX6T3Y5_9SPHN|nr:IS1 family transposase [Sphingomonas daechungensis]QNP44602.1 IS1 family transposase [Sphingomonas daechungensis]